MVPNHTEFRAFHLKMDMQRIIQKLPVTLKEQHQKPVEWGQEEHVLQSHKE